MERTVNFRSEFSGCKLDFIVIYIEAYSAIGSNLFNNIFWTSQLLMKIFMKSCY